METRRRRFGSRHPEIVAPRVAAVGESTNDPPIVGSLEELVCSLHREAGRSWCAASQGGTETSSILEMPPDFNHVSARANEDYHLTEQKLNVSKCLLPVPGGSSRKQCLLAEPGPRVNTEPDESNTCYFHVITAGPTLREGLLNSNYSFRKNTQRQHLNAPNPDDPLANDVAEQWKTNKAQVIETARAQKRLERPHRLSNKPPPPQLMFRPEHSSCLFTPPLLFFLPRPHHSQAKSSKRNVIVVANMRKQQCGPGESGRVKWHHPVPGNFTALPIFQRLRSLCKSARAKQKNKTKKG
ncbi:hypothetical protein A6R68_23145 [Neotoma lepida]|uniref:Uncharacterized protein n=1 Tax=Neotoma lepida TaxID=56216 RepID=A0A1A6HXA8_NEOLE|nr:hypothetical protein A6R68_23145 [Neotoma lepida]